MDEDYLPARSHSRELVRHLDHMRRGIPGEAYFYDDDAFCALIERHPETCQVKHEFISFVSTTSSGSGSPKLYKIGTELMFPLVQLCGVPGVSKRAAELVYQAYPAALLEKGKYGQLPIQDAIIRGASAAVVKVLLEANPDSATVTDEHGRGLLQEAFLRGASADVVKLLLELDPEPARVAEQHIHGACRNEHKTSASVVKLLLEVNREAAKKLDYSLPIFCAVGMTQEQLNRVSRSPHGILPLHRACANNLPAHAIELLLKANLDAAKVVDREGELPLHSACRSKASADVVKLLLEAYPATDVPSLHSGERAGFLPLHLACKYDSPAEVVKLLVDHYKQAVSTKCYDVGKWVCFPMCKDKGENRTPLGLAKLYSADPEVIRILEAAETN